MRIAGDHAGMGTGCRGTRENTLARKLQKAVPRQPGRTQPRPQAFFHMKVTPHITFLHTERSAAVEDRIHDELADLESIYDRITSCRVVVEAPAAGERHGQLFHVRIFLAVPGSEIVVDHSPDGYGSLKQSGAREVKKKDEAGQEHMDVYVAISDAFAAARRQLEKYAESLREIGSDRDSLSAAGVLQD